MNRLRQPGDSDYDVLGLSPDASDEEIDSVFRWLIDGEGYRVGVPLKRQWLRAHQIKAAYAALSDPAKRRADDNSLSAAPEPAAWIMTADDPATNALVMPAFEPDAAEPIENDSPPEAVVSRKPEERPPAASKPERTPDRALEPDAEEVVGIAAAPSDDEHAPAPAFNDNEPAPSSRRAVPIAVAAGLGLVLLSSWLAWDQPSAGEMAPKVAANAERASDAEPAVSPQLAGNIDAAATSSSGEQVVAPGAAPADSDASGRPIEVDGAAGDSAARDAGDLAASSAARVQSSSDAMPEVATPAAAGASSTPSETAEVKAIAPAPTPPVAAPAIATAPPRPRTAPAITGARVGTGSRVSPVRKPPRWVGGGPTGADNRRGRYRGIVAVQVTVDPSGRVANCAAVRGSGNLGLDALTCRLVQERARFTPALNAQGRPVVSQAYTTIVWGRRRRR